MPTYKFDYELHHTIVARTKKEAIKQARAIMRKRAKTGIWFSARIKKISDKPEFPKRRRK